jgi:hypothetical protein
MTLSMRVLSHILPGRRMPAVRFTFRQDMAVPESAGRDSFHLQPTGIGTVSEPHDSPTSGVSAAFGAQHFVAAGACRNVLDLFQSRT